MNLCYNNIQYNNIQDYIRIRQLNILNYIIVPRFCNIIYILIYELFILKKVRKLLK